MVSDSRDKMTSEPVVLEMIDRQNNRRRRNQNQENSGKLLIGRLLSAATPMAMMLAGIIEKGSTLLP
jgi:hypothetical protein